MPFAISRWFLCAMLLSAHAAHGKEILLATSESLTVKTESASKSLTLNAAIQKVLASSSRLKSAESGVLTSEGNRTQAGLWDNPELGVQEENFAGSGPYNGFDSSDTTIGVSQLIELGGKRASRIAVADQEVALSRLGQEAERLDVIRDTTTAFASAVAAQEMLTLAAEQKELANDLFKEVGERVDAAREPLIQKSKAEITLSAATFAHERAERELGHAKHVLSTLWGGHDGRFRLQGKDYFKLAPPLTEAKAEALIEANPRLKLYQTNHARMQAIHTLEKAQAIPDPRFNIGVRDSRNSSTQSFVAGISIPIPVINRNQGNVEKARHQVSQAESDAQTARLFLIGGLHQSLEDQTNAYRQAKSLKATILPAAEKAFTLSREGYRTGKLPYLEVLDAQRTLFEVKEQYITTLKEYHIAKAEVERLTARHAEPSATKEEAHAK